MPFSGFRPMSKGVAAKAVRNDDDGGVRLVHSLAQSLAPRGGIRIGPIAKLGAARLAQQPMPVGLPMRRAGVMQTRHDKKLRRNRR
jgi:hypothetical protein